MDLGQPQLLVLFHKQVFKKDRLTTRRFRTRLHSRLFCGHGREPAAGERVLSWSPPVTAVKTTAVDKISKLCQGSDKEFFFLNAIHQRYFPLLTLGTCTQVSQVSSSKTTSTEEAHAQILSNKTQVGIFFIVFEFLCFDMYWQ